MCRVCNETLQSCGICLSRVTSLVVDGPSSGCTDLDTCTADALWWTCGGHSDLEVKVMCHNPRGQGMTLEII